MTSDNVIPKPVYNVLVVCG